MTLKQLFIIAENMNLVTPGDACEYCNEFAFHLDYSFLSDFAHLAQSHNVKYNVEDLGNELLIFAAV